MEGLKKLRNEIDKIDEEIVKLLAKRSKIAMKIAKYKKEHGLQIYDARREREVIEKVKKLARNNGLDETLLEKVFQSIIIHTRESEKQI